VNLYIKEMIVYLAVIIRGKILCLDSDVECDTNKQFGGPDITECTDSNSSDEEIINEITTNRGKKRNANSSIWKRNLVKIQIATGEEYTSICTKKKRTKTCDWS